MKIKIIDLLNKVINGEEIPNKIRYLGLEYLYKRYKNDYLLLYSDEEIYFFEDTISTDLTFGTKILLREVEIIEEYNSFTGVKFFSDGNCFSWVDTSGKLKPKDDVVVDSKIEKIDIGKMLQTKKWKRDKNAWKKINELIDEVNILKENK